MDWIEVLCYSNQFKCKSASRIKYEQLHQSVLFFERISTNISRYQPTMEPLPTKNVFTLTLFFFKKKIMNFIKSNSVKMKVATAEVQWNQSYKLHGKMYWGFLCVHNHFIFIGFAAFFPALLLLLFVIVFARLYHSNFFRSISSILWLYTKSKDKQMAKNIKNMNVCLV